MNESAAICFCFLDETGNKFAKGMLLDAGADPTIYCCRVTNVDAWLLASILQYQHINTPYDFGNITGDIQKPLNSGTSTREEDMCQSSTECKTGKLE
jgi:hypothetical protein